jgi:hypothetical protein
VVDHAFSRGAGMMITYDVMVPYMMVLSGLGLVVIAALS